MERFEAKGYAAGRLTWERVHTGGGCLAWRAEHDGREALITPAAGYLGRLARPTERVHVAVYDRDGSFFPEAPCEAPTLGDGAAVAFALLSRLDRWRSGDQRLDFRVEDLGGGCRVLARSLGGFRAQIGAVDPGELPGESEPCLLVLTLDSSDGDDPEAFGFGSPREAQIVATLLLETLQQAVRGMAEGGQ